MFAAKRLQVLPLQLKRECKRSRVFTGHRKSEHSGPDHALMCTAESPNGLPARSQLLMKFECFQFNSEVRKQQHKHTMVNGALWRHVFAQRL